jgi:hypothetical protein
VQGDGVRVAHEIGFADEASAGFSGLFFREVRTPGCRFALIAGTGRVRHFKALPETRPFATSKVGLEALFLYT